MGRSLSLPLVGLLIAAGALGACRDSGKESEYFAISGKLFEFNYRLAKATYVVTLNPLKPVGEGQVAVVSFENPAGGEPIVVQQKIWPKLPHVTLESPPLTCVVKDKPYAVSIKIQGPDGGVMQTIDTTITSSLDESILPDRPLVIGPVYELNKDLAGHPDGRLPNEPKPDCPAKA
ncbi:hypothetical protein SAZ10_24800 [Mesorhizobium sp. BAC0120]|uniref:hypothetical protein n=1 Tax=Mesorhizobium sp. BAC0120 TaxID=3090670 RepID=UPI00298CD79D|nr:hypothetical protein [Mesorhizobium sp. BAC0120]MDW6024981.1 hypothetical protein [Mesorhizobium sp. BAC0120]